MTRAVELAQVASTGVSEAFKNRIINGAMTFDQRNGGAVVTTSVLQQQIYTLDRWGYYNDVVSKRTIQQSSVAPVGFNNSLLVTIISTDTVGPQQFIRQPIEGFNMADFGWGTANARTVTLSFWVRSSVTGQMGGVIQNANSTRSYPFAYTISAANTWEYKTVLITGPTDGTWLTTNGLGLQLLFENGPGFNAQAAGSWANTNCSTSTGSVNLCATNGATWYITGVQLEVGSSATSFEYRPYGTELQLCQRYLYRIGGATQYARMGIGPAQNTTTAAITIFMQTPMRAIPSSVTQTGALTLWNGGGLSSVSSISLLSGECSPFTVAISCTSSGLTAGTTYQIIGNNDATAAIAISAEL